MAFRTGVRLPSPPRNMHACEYGSFPVLLSPVTSGVTKYWRMKVDRGHASSLRPAACRTALQHGVERMRGFRVFFRHIAKAVDKFSLPAPSRVRVAPWTANQSRLRSVVGRTYPPRATDARDARFETCCSTLAGLPVERVFRAGGIKDPHMQPSGQVGSFNLDE